MPPNEPKQDYSFILKSQPGVPKTRLNLNRNAVFFGAGVLLILLIAILLFAGRGGKQPDTIAVAARATEIARVSDLVAQNTTDPATKNLASTVSVAMNSESAQIVSYLASVKIKVGADTLAADKNTSIDGQLETAAQNNSFAQTYQSYLKTALNNYLAQISKAEAGTGVNGKSILNDAAVSTRALLDSAPLKT